MTAGACERAEVSQKAGALDHGSQGARGQKHLGAAWALANGMHKKGFGTEGARNPSRSLNRRCRRW